jgi:Glycosyl transferase family 11
MRSWIRSLPIFPQPDQPWIRPSLFWSLTSRYLEADRVHRIQGGLGNQMFQYAHAWALHEAFPARVRVDLSSFQGCREDRPYLLEEVFDMPDRFSHVPYAKMQKCGRLRLDRFDRSEETTVKFKAGFLGHDLRGFVSGYFPSFRYMKSIEAKVRRNFRYKQPLPTESVRWAKLIAGNDSVAIHVRRGDYLRPENKEGFFGICTKEYYQAAREVVRRLRPQARFFIFSDDPAWCRDDFAEADDVIISAAGRTPDWVDMALMSQCEHAITANSSFSLWARWIGGIGGRHISISPARFYNAEAFGSSPHCMIPAEFIRIDELGAVRTDIEPS